MENSPTRPTCPTLASYCPTRPFSPYVGRLETLFFNLTLIGPTTGVDSYRKCKGPSISLCKLLLYRSKPSPSHAVVRCFDQTLLSWLGDSPGNASWMTSGVKVSNYCAKPTVRVQGDK